jgi:hypothetical protein
MKQITTNTDLAYFAGYIDGDGCFYIGKYIDKKTKRIKYQSRLIISSTNRDIFKHFKTLYGGIIRMSDNRIKYPGQKPQYQFIISGNSASKITDKITNILHEKRFQADFFVKFSNTKSKSQKDYFIDLFHDIKEHFYVSKDRIYLIKNGSYRITPKEEDYAYLAGFIDAECSLGIQHYKPKNKPNQVYKIYLKCNNTQSPIFHWLYERFGGQLQFINRNNKNINHKDQIMWTLSGKALSQILPYIFKYIQYKKPVCEQLMKFDATTLKNGGARHTEKFRESYAKIIKERELIIHEVHRLNKKGIPI